MMNQALRRCLFVLLGVVCLLTAVITAATALTTPTAQGGINLSLDTFATGLSNPVSLANADAGYGRLFVVEQAGRIKIVEANGSVRSTPFLDITDRVASGGETGLLGLAFHPDYYENGYFYVNYTNGSGGLNTRISRFQVTADSTVADPNSEDILFTVPQPFPNHNAGDIHFGSDGYLYIPLGDGGDGGDPLNNAQTMTRVLGKILRIDVDVNSNTSPSECENVGGSNHYAIPADNPFVGSDGACDLIWVSGFRNPWRSSFDRLTGDLYVGDVGQGSWEEVDYQPATSTGGENYGWRCYEGDHPFNTSGCSSGSQYTPPIFEFVSTGNCSVIGGYVYRGEQYPALNGRYLVTDYCSGNFWDLVVDDSHQFTPTLHTNLTTSGYVAFGETADCELYLANIQSDTIYHIQAGTRQATAGGTALCNNRPVALADRYDVLAEQTLSVTAPGVLSNDGDMDGDDITAVLVTSPQHGTLAFNTDGSFVYTPTIGFHGLDSFTYRVMDAFDESGQATVTIGVNTPPVAASDAYTTSQNTPLMLVAPGLLDNDSDEDGDKLTAVLDSEPSHGEVALADSGSFVYTPTTDFIGSDSFSYVAFDGISSSNVATVTIEVVVGNAPPVAVSDHYTTVRNTTFTINAPGVLGNDADPNGDMLTAVLDTPPLSGTLSFNADGSFTYTPTVDFIGLVTFTYHAADGQSQSAVTTVTIFFDALTERIYLPFVANNTE